MHKHVFQKIHHYFVAIVAAVAVLLVALGANTASAQQFNSTHGDWNVYTIMQKGKKVCYMASSPKKKKGNYTKRGEPYLLVTGIDKNVDEVSVSSGYGYKVGVEVSAVVDNKNTYKMFTKGELAWAYDTKQDQEMIAAMKKGSNIKIRGTSTKGTYSEDSYSLSGFSKAYDKIKSVCGS